MKEIRIDSDSLLDVTTVIERLMRSEANSGVVQVSCSNGDQKLMVIALPDAGNLSKTETVHLLEAWLKLEELKMRVQYLDDGMSFVAALAQFTSRLICRTQEAVALATDEGEE